MNRFNIKEQILNLFALVLLQLPLLYKITLFERAFAFFYIGFLLLLPVTLSKSYLMIVGFFTGLIVDVFSNTPGIHAGACVLVMFIRNIWLRVVEPDMQELTNLNVSIIKGLGFLKFMFPLIFLHHVVIFTVENGGLYLFRLLGEKIFYSSMFSFIIIFIVSMLTAQRKYRL